MEHTLHPCGWLHTYFFLSLAIIDVHLYAGLVLSSARQFGHGICHAR